MDALTSALNEAIERALAGGAGQLTREELISMSRSDVEQAVARALGDTALHAAISAPGFSSKLLLDMARTGKTEQVIGALQRGADHAVRDDAGRTPLILAAGTGKAACVNVLLRARADVEAVGADGRSSLATACAAGHEEVVIALLDRGARPPAPAPDAAAGADIYEPMLDLLRPDEELKALAVFAHYKERIDRRTEAAGRVGSYVRGTLPSTAWPPAYVARPWSEHAHKYMPPALREAVLSLLSASSRRSEGESGWLPPELWVHVFRFMHRDWVAAPGRKPSTAAAAAQLARLAAAADEAGRTADEARRRRQQAGQEAAGQPGEGEGEGEGAGGAGGSGAGGSAAAAAEAAEEDRLLDELRVAEESLRMLSLVTRGDPAGVAAVAGPIRDFEAQSRQLRAQLAGMGTPAPETVEPRHRREARG